MIYPHAGDFISAKINRKALEYNVPLMKNDIDYCGPDFAPLCLQSMKLSEDGTMAVYRLSEQDGMRGRLDLGRKMKVLNMLEDEIGETDCVEYSPFEIITLGAEI
jgi:alpha-mannosidase